MKTCTRCGHEGPLDDFPRDRSRADGRFPQCKACNKRRSRAWVEAHPDEAKGYQRAYKESNREALRAYGREHSRQRYKRLRDENPEVWRCYVRLRRARQRANRITLPSLGEVVARVDRCGRACVYCDGPYEHLDHAIPIAGGGLDAIANLVPACASCNLSKGTKDWRSWLRGRPSFSAAREATISQFLEDETAL